MIFSGISLTMCMCFAPYTSLEENQRKGHFCEYMYTLWPLLEAWKIKGVGIFKETNCSYLLSKKITLPGDL